MQSQSRVLPDRLHRRRCVSCGHGGIQLQGDPAATSFRCPACNADLYARPARTYAEMEGFVEAGPAPSRAASFDRISRLLLAAPAVAAEQRRRRRVRLMFCCVFLAGAFMIVVAAAAWAATA